MNRRPTARPGRALAACAMLLLLPVVAVALVAEHPSQLPQLTPDTQFPRCTERELAMAGFPDHMHGWWWPDWTPPTGADGQPTGPRSICLGKELTPRDGLVLGPGEIRYNRVRLAYDPRYATCDMMLFVELLDWAEQRVSAYLGLEASGLLSVVSPDDNDAYRRMTGNDVWRLYGFVGDEAVVEPVPILMARTLEGHAAFQVVTHWLLASHFGDRLPPWLLYGLVEYCAEDGVHLVNYMAQFRSQGPILFSPPLIDTLLGGAPDPDRNRDREMFRRASYSAYLMVWQLVENEGGLQALREFLDLAAAGESLDEAATRVYGLDMADLAAMLDPVALGEPIGRSVESRKPHVQP